MARGPAPGKKAAAVGPKAGGRGRSDAWKNSALNHGNPFVLADDEDSGQQSVTITRDPKDQEVKGIPVGLFVAVKGELQFEPLKGFEHLVHPQVGDRLSRQASAPEKTPSQPVSTAPVAASAINTTAFETAVAPQVPPALAAPPPLQSTVPTPKRLPKRPRAVAHSQQSNVPVVRTVSSFTFYIADIDALRQFYEVRLNEFTLKPIRKILTEWVSFASPKRRRFYGKYKKKTLPRDLVDGNAPPWWPDDVYYEEPSHLESRELKKLGAGILLLHRFTNSETNKPRDNWVRELRRIAEHIVHMTPVDEFTSSSVKVGSKYNADMKARALNEIIPDLFDTAQSYEDHVAQYYLYDGRNSSNPDSLRGKQHTWAPIRRPERSGPSRSGRNDNKRARVGKRQSPSADTIDFMETDEVVNPSKKQDIPSSQESPATSSASQHVFQVPQEDTAVRRNSEPVRRRNRKPMPASYPASGQQSQLPTPPSRTAPESSAFIPQASFSSLSLSPAPAMNGLPYSTYLDMQMNDNTAPTHNYVGPTEAFNYPGHRWPMVQYVPVSDSGFNDPPMQPYFPCMPNPNTTLDYPANIQSRQNSFSNPAGQSFYMPPYHEKVPMQSLDMHTPSTPMDCKMSFGSAMSFDLTNPADEMMMPPDEHHLTYSNAQTHHQALRN